MASTFEEKHTRVQTQSKTIMRTPSEVVRHFRGTETGEIIMAERKCWTGKSIEPIERSPESVEYYFTSTLDWIIINPNLPDH